MKAFFQELNIGLVSGGSTFRRVFEWIFGSFVNIIVAFVGKEFNKTGNFGIIAREGLIISSLSM